jgi:hypothetical protein
MKEHQYMMRRGIYDRQRPWRLGLENWELEGCPLLYACADGKLEPGDSGRKVQVPQNIWHFFY